MLACVCVCVCVCVCNLPRQGARHEYMKGYQTTLKHVVLKHIFLTCMCVGVQGYEYMVGYQTTCEASGRVEPVIGWYHSHPGYGCWLSGIDVNTQLTHQQVRDLNSSRNPCTYV